MDPHGPSQTPSETWGDPDHWLHKLPNGKRYPGKAIVFCLPDGRTVTVPVPSNEVAPTADPPAE